MAGPRVLCKADFANIDGRVRCPADGCLGDLLLMPTGATDHDGVPIFHPFTQCPLCGRDYRIASDMSDRELYLRIAWLRANPGADLGESPRAP